MTPDYLPNAIRSAALANEPGKTMHYGYDQKGNRITDSIDDGSTTTIRARFHYDANNLLIASTRGQSFENGSMEEAMYFRYGVDQQRFLKVEETTNTDDMTQTKEATIYAGPHFEEVINLTSLKKELKLQVNDYLTLTVKGNNHMEKHFMQKDRLGSTTRILDQDMASVKTMSYDVFGKPRRGNDWLKMTSPELDFSVSNDANEIDITKRGFTDHEHLDNFELIHMNGRMYDFNNGRFLSVDPFIQGVTSQAINPYSYIQNNPLSGVDPTGYLMKCEGFNCPEESPGERFPGSREWWEKRVSLNSNGSGDDSSKHDTGDNSEINEQADVYLKEWNERSINDMFADGTFMEPDPNGFQEYFEPPLLFDLIGDPIAAWRDDRMNPITGRVLSEAEAFDNRVLSFVGGFFGRTTTTIKSIEKTVPLFRAVGPSEYDDIFTSRQFNLVESSVGKQFGKVYSELLDLANQKVLNNTGAVIQVDVLESAVKKFDHTPVDQMFLKSGSVTVQPEDINLLNDSIRKIKQID